MVNADFSRRAVGAGMLFLVMALVASFNLDQRLARQRGQIVDVEMFVAEQGGFAPASVRVRAGEPVHFRLHGGDVAHAVAFGPGVGVESGVIAPGERRTVTLTFAQPGVYTYYCNLWCSKEHWRMRGVIEVVDDAGQIPPAAPDPVIAALAAEGVDLDAAHGADHAQPAPQEALSPLVDAAALATLAVPEPLRSPEWRRTHALADAIAALAVANPGRAASEVAAAAAALWLENRADGATAAIGDLYAKNCAACHGARGAGDGPAANDAATTPAAFTVATLAERRSDVLYAKIRRGGMGTGMPNFGTLFTPEESWSLVDYLWVLALDEGMSSER